MRAVGVLLVGVLAVALTSHARVWYVCLVMVACLLVVAAEWVRWRVGAHQPPVAPVGAMETIRMLADERKVMPFLMNITRGAYGGVVRLRWPSVSPFVLVTQPEAMKLIMTHTTSEKPRFLFYRKDMVTRQWSIFNKKTSDPSWHAARKAVAPAFSSAALRQHVQSTHVATLRGLLRRMDAHAADAAPWPVAVDTYTFALDALMASAFCVPGDAMEDTSSELREVRANAVLAVQALGKVGLMPWKAWFWWLWPDMRRVMAAGRHNRDFMRRTLRAYRTSQHASSDRSVLGHLVRAPYASDEERVQDMLVFMTAGHDTTAGTLTLALMDLAESPHVLVRVAAEVDAALPSAEEAAADELPDDWDEQVQRAALPLMRACLKESMRLWPIAALGVLRTVDCDVTLPDGVRLRPGTRCMLPFFAAFRAPWIDHPDEYRPERWAPDAPQRKQLEASITPFALGRRNCVGMPFAVFSMEATLAAIVRRYRVTMVCKPPVKLSFLLTPDEGTLLRLERRPQLTNGVHSG